MALANRETRIEQQSAKIKAFPPAKLPLASLVLGALSFLGMMISLWMIFLYAPTEQVQGDAQRVRELHDLDVDVVGDVGRAIVERQQARAARQRLQERQQPCPDRESFFLVSLFVYLNLFCCHIDFLS